jgi:hypothetical protein
VEGIIYISFIDKKLLSMYNTKVFFKLTAIVAKKKESVIYEKDYCNSSLCYDASRLCSMRRYYRKQE